MTTPPASLSPSHRPTNRLAREKSPYLLQHQHNPVDWYAWGPEAFAKARAGNKPIFLSIGYSTCHWCHVMERESFENEETAQLLNDQFVAIKVDREERPDVDKIYMTYVQARTGGGGWPLNVFLTPDLKPFYGGTYWPPAGRQGRPGFREVLRQIADLWKEHRGEVLESAQEMTERLRLHAESSAKSQNGVLPAALSKHAAEVMKEEFDSRHGGFGGAPKFPRPSLPAFLLRYGSRTGDREAVRMVATTCERMSAGGMHDQLGGGFARYSVDAAWRVPHFEKMLYDNAQLIHLYLDAYAATGEKRFADVVRSTVAYVLRDMTHPDGGFFSAEDADSEGHEGKFYCWTRAELHDLLSPEEFAVAVRYFGVTERGNFVDHSHPTPLLNLNVLSLADSEVAAAEMGPLEAARRKMLAARGRRIRPHLDDKVLASWNGLMLGALARAAVMLNEPAWTRAAAKNLAFLQAKLWDPTTQTLSHRWRDGGRDATQLLDDYAYLLDGVLHFYEATLDPALLEFALALAATMTTRFLDREQGGFWQSEAGSIDLILRLKEDYDGAEPSGNSMAALALLRLSAIAERPDLRRIADGTIALFAERLMKRPEAMPQMLQAVEFALTEPRRVVIAGDWQSVEARRLLAAAHEPFQPNKVVLGTGGPVEPFARTLATPNDPPKAYVCTGTACLPPTQDAAALRKMMK